MYALLWATWLSARAVSCARLSSPLGPVVDLRYAAFAGNTTSPAGIANGSVAFFGAIPYARPPLGNLRFRAPRQLNETGLTKQVTDARNWGPPCIQQPAVVGIGSEDCLTLDIWKPTNASEGTKLPVVVYIHGGGFFRGTPEGFPMYDWIAQNNRIVAVSITYRLGMLGFLGGPAVAADGDLNVGLLDQRAGLEWVQRHITKFGGDPANVTISGESAGGASVVMQVVAYGGSKPAPFRRAIAQSIGFGPTSTEAQVEATFKNAVSFVGCPENSMSCLRAASIGAIVSAINRTPNGQFSPIIDGPSGFLPDLPSRLISAGNFNTVDFIGGHCTGDGRTFAGGKPSQFITEDDVRRLVFSRWPGVSNATIDNALRLYPSPDTPGSPFATQYDRAYTMAGEIIFTCMDWFLANKLRSKAIKNVFAYSWDAPDTVLYNTNPFLGAMHTSDLYYLFSGMLTTHTFGNAGNTFTAFNTSETVLSKEAIAYWTSFAAKGDPNARKDSNSPGWPTFEDSTDVRLRLIRGNNNNNNTDTRSEDISMQEIQRCQFWMSENVTAETLV
ncbi:Alpha/Beta hydrolase protein [Crucibulum laeve]|uniref:Carboxylic ester hydrolase n=1 Tax=Crucibulum laeve TaxID=68775 RepID=A0A5C3LYX9_9AGAR|nr:Alpha/Beta hydrolase protein [Crucibulum laeve]